MFLDLIDIKLFLISFAVGLYFIYVTNESPKIIFKYNTSEEEENNIIKSESVECPKD